MNTGGMLLTSMLALASVGLFVSVPAPASAAPAVSRAAATPAPATAVPDPTPPLPADAIPKAESPEALTVPPQGVTPLPLNEALEQGLSQNPRMKVAAERVVQARAKYEEIRSNKGLKFNFNNQTTGQGSRSVDTSQIFPQGTGVGSTMVLVNSVQDQISMYLQQLLTTFGRVENQIAAALVNIGAVTQNAETERRQLLLDLKQAYFQRLRAEATERVSVMNLDSAKQTLSDTEARFREGLLARYDVLQADLEVTDAQQRLDTARTDLTTTEVRLRSVMFDPTPRTLWSVPPAPVVVDVATPVASLQQVALEHRPELSALNLNLAASKKLLAAAKADNAPTLSLQFNYMTNLGNLIMPSDYVNGVLTFNWLLGDGGQRNARVRNAESELRMIEDNIALQHQAVSQQVQEAWAALLLALKNVDTANRRLDTALAFHFMARARFVGGVGTSLEMQNAVRNLNNARLDAVVERNQLDLAFAALEQSLGVDFPDRRLVLPPTVTPPASSTVPPPGTLSAPVPPKGSWTPSPPGSPTAAPAPTPGTPSKPAAPSPRGTGPQTSPTPARPAPDASPTPGSIL